ncbi:hypothetical protein M501DRAFT_1021618 [Patellaria atrata CBS 101060]|uniref:Uncharacterized protein n=1 Tax=Patellaria atrata CBS 101060 TaxID=1346257 RepID=A0A9P4SIQ8_9PEZI|nr:hypothetical protein M501DRAFT_1021618 [Patellaria atrata CBS 101060]
MHRLTMPVPITQALTGQHSNPNTPSTARVRVHITPFNPSLQKYFLPPNVLPLASNISFHTVQTFPEKGYGYVELPVTEVQKMKKKLNGSILKGSKVRIEEAKPEKRKAGDDGVDGEETAGASKKARKAKPAKDALPGYELPEGRQVKRGWTDPKAHSSREKESKSKKSSSTPSRYTRGPELLFRTDLPPNKLADVVDATKSSKSKDKSKNLNSKKESQLIVHEFSKTTKHASFLKENQRINDSKTTFEHVEGKGWMDKDGNIVEAEDDQRRRSKRKLRVENQTQEEQKPIKVIEGKVKPIFKTNGTVNKESDRSRLTAEVKSDETEDVLDASSDDSSSVVSSSDSSDNSSSAGSPDEVSSASEDENAGDGTIQKEVHPLEALFKRPKLPGAGRPAPINTAFNFFEHEATDPDITENAPHTPFTRQDLHIRGLRSAAPTPDTAAIGGKFAIPWRYGGDDDQIDEEDEEDDSFQPDANATPLGKRQQKQEVDNDDVENGEEQSEFAKYFWEKRGDLNRKWKKRKRETEKAKRQRENRRIGKRIV